MDGADKAYLLGQIDGFHQLHGQNPYPCPKGEPDIDHRRRLRVLEEAWTRGRTQCTLERRLGLSWPDTPDQRYTRATYASTLASWPESRSTRTSGATPRGAAA